MGKLLRRYWQPVGAIYEFHRMAAKDVRFFGEDLVLFRDKSGKFGLVSRNCSHRGTSLALGIPEAHGLRCAYHGWLFDHDGNCVSQPFENPNNEKFRQSCRIGSYPVVPKAGLLWAYFGPSPAPCLPDWDFYSSPGYKEINFATVPCNWLQCQENSMDPIHFEWLHDYAMGSLFGKRTDREGPVRRHARIDFDEFEWGFVYRRLWEGETEAEPSWKIGRVSLWPNCFYPGGPMWHVPIDDVNTFIVVLTLLPLPNSITTQQDTIPCWQVSTQNEKGQPLAGQQQQDMLVFAGQGAIQNRLNEHLGTSDAGIAMFRKRLKTELQALEEGRDPKGVLRDPARNHRIPLPAYEVHGTINPHFAPVFAGRPKEVIEEYVKFCRKQQSPVTRSQELPKD